MHDRVELKCYCIAVLGRVHAREIWQAVKKRGTRTRLCAATPRLANSAHALIVLCTTAIGETRYIGVVHLESFFLSPYCLLQSLGRITRQRLGSLMWSN